MDEFFCEKATLERGCCPCSEQCRQCALEQAFANVQPEPSAWQRVEEEAAA